MPKNLSSAVIFVWTEHALVQGCWPQIWTLWLHVLFQFGIRQDKTGHWFWIKTVEGKNMPTGSPQLTQFTLMQIPLTCCLFYVSVKHLLGQDRALVLDQDRWGKNFCRMSSTYAISTNLHNIFVLFQFGIRQDMTGHWFWIKTAEGKIYSVNLLFRQYVENCCKHKSISVLQTEEMQNTK